MNMRVEMEKLANFGLFILPGLIFAIITVFLGACITGGDDESEILIVAWVAGVFIYAITFTILYSPNL